MEENEPAIIEDLPAPQLAKLETAMELEKTTVQTSLLKYESVICTYTERCKYACTEVGTHTGVERERERPVDYYVKSQDCQHQLHLNPRQEGPVSI